MKGLEMIKSLTNSKLKIGTRVVLQRDLPHEHYPLYELDEGVIAQCFAGGPVGVVFQRYPGEVMLHRVIDSVKVMVVDVCLPHPSAPSQRREGEQG